MNAPNQAGRVGVVVSFKARQGARDALAAHLLSAAATFADETGTELFAVNLSPVDPDLVVVVEIYANAAAKQAHETHPAYAALRAATMAFVAGPPAVTPLLPIGGKGV